MSLLKQDSGPVVRSVFHSIAATTFLPIKRPVAHSRPVWTRMGTGRSMLGGRLVHIQRPMDAVKHSAMWDGV